MYNIHRYAHYRKCVNYNKILNINNLNASYCRINYFTTIPNRKRSLITLTDRALNEIRKVTQEGHIIKLSLVTKGCNGYTYDMALVDDSKIDALDEYHVDASGNKVLAIDNKAIMYVLGTRIDFVEHEDGISSEFTFTNPNVGSCCGCGLSFNINKSND